MTSLESKVVAVTGAASGLGRALACEAARHGALLALSDVDETGLEETERLAREAGARQVCRDRLDVGDREAFHSYARQVVEQLGGVDVLVNNAGVMLVGDFVDLEPDDMEWIMRTNFWGVVHGTQAFLPHLIASGDGHLVNISSLFGLVSVPSQSLYCASKHAVTGMSEAVREEMLVAGHPVRVTVVHPGGLMTAIAPHARVSARTDKLRMSDLFNRWLAVTDPDRAARVVVRAMLAGKPRVLVGPDAHAMYQLVRLVGSRYQDVVARMSRPVLPPITKGREPRS